MRLREFLDERYPQVPKVQVNANKVRGKNALGDPVEIELTPLFHRIDPLSPAQILLGSYTYYCGRIFYHDAKGWDFNG